MLPISISSVKKLFLLKDLAGAVAIAEEIEKADSPGRFSALAKRKIKSWSSTLNKEQ